MPATKAVRTFGPADDGVKWAIAKLPGGAKKGKKIVARGCEVELAPFAAAKGEDDYSIKFAGQKSVKVLANTAVGTISGLLKLGELLRAGSRKDVTQNLTFRTRNYKHEISFGEGHHGILRYTDAMWEQLCQQIVSHQFNGLVLYPGYHPFEHILDYKGFPEAASQPAAHRAAVRKVLNRGLAIAHRYGLKTFMQHYVSHFTPQLAEAYQIPTTGRLAAIDHPDIERYCRYCYKEIFRQVPELDGLYFNFESYGSAWKHVLATAVPACNAMKRKPIFAFRLWDFIAPDGMRKIMKTYKGRIILGHKIPDTGDVYYLPVADSRVMEWKKRLGKQIEWMFLVGPCHNCGTNLCQQLWGDYAYVQTLLADAQKKGADSFSFHTVNEFFSPDVGKSPVFSDQELSLARFNRMHLQAVVDYVNGKRASRGEQAAMLAKRAGVKPAAGPALLDAVEASSQLVLLIYQQFYNTSAFDGYLNWRYSDIQDPFYYYPANAMNDQHKSLLWRGFIAAWVQKTLPAKVAPDKLLQHILDYVDPSKKKAERHPRKIADLLGQNLAKTQSALAKYRRLAGKAAAAKLEPLLANNAALGEYVRHEILAAIQLYSVYFATSKDAVVKALRKGLAELQQNTPLVADPESPAVKSMYRAMMDGLNPKREIALTEEALSLIEGADFPMDAFRAYLDSRRAYNEIRRVVRSYRQHDAEAIAYAVKQLKASMAKAQQALAALKAPQHQSYAQNIRAWLEFVENELARTTPPATACPSAPTGPFLPLQHNECFRSGDNFLEEYCGFFRTCDYLRSVDQSFQVWHNDRELVVTLRERGVDPAQRKAQWEKYKNSGSDCFVTRVYLDTENKGFRADDYIVWPAGAGVSRNRQPRVKARLEFSSDANSWQITIGLPYDVIGKRPRKGEVWGLNVMANPAVAKNASYTWAPQYDAMNPRLFGKIKFE